MGDINMSRYSDSNDLTSLFVREQAEGQPTWTSVEEQPTWTSVIDGHLLRHNPFEPNPSYPQKADEHDIFHAFNILAKEIYSPATKQTLFVNALLFAVVFLGNFAGAEYAENFAETFSDKLFDADSGVGFEFFSYYIPTVYMIANISISMISAGKTIDEIKKFLKGNPLYEEWMKHNRYYLGLEKAQQLVSALFAGFACFALIAQNKDPDQTKSAASYYFALICQYIGVATNVALFTRSFTTLFEKYFTDFNAAITGNIKDRENLYAAKVYMLRKLADLPKTPLHISVNMVAQGYNNTITPVIDPLATAASVWLLYPYITVNYGDAAEAATDNQTALTMSNFATYGVLALCAKATAGIATTIFDKIHSKVTHTPKIHHSSDSSLLGLFTKLIAVAIPSMAAAAGRFAEFSHNPLETREQVIEAALNALRAAGINLADVDRVTSLLYKRSAQYAPTKSFGNWANKTKYGASIEEFMSRIMQNASSDSFIRQLLTPITDPNGAFKGATREEARSSQSMKESDTLLDGDDDSSYPTIEVNSQGYPAASIFGQVIKSLRGCSLFQPNNDIKTFAVKDTQFLNAVHVLESAKRDDRFDLEKLYRDWLENPLAQPKDIEVSDDNLLETVTAR